MNEPFLLFEDIILPDYLALERTKLANERTLLSYLRASIYLLLGDLAFVQLEGFTAIKWLGFISLIASIALLVIGVKRFRGLNHRLKIYYQKRKEEEVQENNTLPS